MWVNKRTRPHCMDRYSQSVAIAIISIRQNGTRRHYAKLPGSTENYSRPVHSKITLTYSLAWWNNRCSPQRITFKALFCSRFLCAYCSKKLPERAPTKSQLRVLSIIDQLRECAHQRFAYAQLSPLYPSLYPYVAHVINYPSPLQLFRTARWVGPGNEVIHYVHCCFNTFWPLCCRCKSL